MIVDFESMKQVFFLLWLAEWLKRNPNIAFVIESLCKIISESNSEDKVLLENLLEGLWEQKGLFSIFRIVENNYGFLYLIL